MDLQAIMTLISSVGFPIAMCLLLMYYIKYREEQNTIQTKELNESYERREETMRKSIDNNTEALNRLAEKLK